MAMEDGETEEQYSENFEILYGDGKKSRKINIIKKEIYTGMIL